MTLSEVIINYMYCNQFLNAWLNCNKNSFPALLSEKNCDLIFIRILILDKG